ncbi:MAG: ParB N-terminal domain-containing protein [Afipia sp.]|nr:ParB N-terminal domain-containing protein [Afipia sp.]
MSNQNTYELRPDMVAIELLQPFANNARTHSKRQIAKLARSIKTLGIFNPILVDEDRRILAGHARLEAARHLGLSHVPTLRFDHLTDEQKRAYVLADNKIAQAAGWDRDRLATELQELQDIGFDLTLTGFDTAEIDIIFSDVSLQNIEPEPTSPSNKPPICKIGDLFELGHHRIICGDARDADVYQTLLGGERAAFVVTDPPYNVRIERNVSGLGKIRHKDFKMASGELSVQEFTAFLQDSFVQLAKHSLSGSIHIIFMDWRHLAEMMAAGSAVFTELKNVCVWNKSNAGMGSFYRSQHELAFIWKNGDAPHTNNFELGQHGRSRTNVWDYPCANNFADKQRGALQLHPTPKPVALVSDAIKDCSRRGEIVMDSFAGSGTTLISAEQTGRRARVIELDPSYCDVAIRRWQQLTGRDAIHVASGRTFDELSETPME